MPIRLLQSTGALCPSVCSWCRWALEFRSCGLEKVPLSQEHYVVRLLEPSLGIPHWADPSGSSLRGSWLVWRCLDHCGHLGPFGPVFPMPLWHYICFSGDSIYDAAVEHRCDVIISTSMGNTHCLDVAEKLQLLCFALKFCPDIDGQVPTMAFPPSGYPSLGPLNLLLHIVENLRTVAAVFRGGFIPKVIDFRRHLGLPSQEIPMVMEVPLYSEYRQELQANQPSLYAFSPVLAKRPEEYQPWHFVTGSFAKAEPQPMPSQLEAFLEGGDVVCVAFGSMSLLSAAFQEGAVAALRRMGKRVLLVDPEALPAQEPELLKITSAPYSSLFPKCDLVVHHGGAGTFQDCVLANTPQLIAPVLSWSDQPFWAQQLEQRKLGVKLGEGGEAPSSEEWDDAYARRHGTSPVSITFAWPRCFKSLADFKQIAKGASEQMSKEGGVEYAVQIVEEVLAASS